MLEELLEAFPGSRLRREGGAVVGPVCVLDAFHHLRLRFDPHVEVFVDLAPQDGFELELHVGDRWLGDTDIGDPVVDDGFFIRTNDPALARAWLDEPARSTLRAIAGATAAPDRSLGPLFAVMLGTVTGAEVPVVHATGPRMWPVSVRGDRIAASAGGHRAPPAEIVRMVHLAGTLAGGAARWAARCAEAAALTGATVVDVVDRVALGAPAIVLELGRGKVEVRYVRAALGGRAPTLATRVTAHRPVPSPATWAVLGKDAPPPSEAVARGRKLATPPPLAGFVIRATHAEAPPPLAQLAPLLTGLTPACAIVADATEVTAWFPGAQLSPEALALAARLVAQLAHGAALEQGPYR